MKSERPVEAKQVKGIPLGGTHNFQDLSILAPGAPSRKGSTQHSSILR
ncbi:MAG: hypothetical protein ACR2I2_19340 [Bryobacteraceae bacterium]